MYLLPRTIITMVNLGVNLLFRRMLQKKKKWRSLKMKGRFLNLPWKHPVPNALTHTKRADTCTMGAVHQDPAAVSWSQGYTWETCVIILLSPHGLDKFNWM